LNDVVQRLTALWDWSPQGVVNVIDILLVTYVVYRVLKLVRGTRAWRVVLGVAGFVVALVVSDYLELRTLHWLLDKATILGPVALVILFLPELRQAIEGFGRFGGLAGRFGLVAAGANAIEETIAAVTEMAEQRIGAIIVIERGTSLDDVAANGVMVNGVVSAGLLGAIFHPGNQLHDGAALVRRDTVVAAACRLPLSESQIADPHVHMRHRAGLGISEQSDAVVVVVSEERGTVTLAVDGVLTRPESVPALREMLYAELRGPAPISVPRRWRSRPKAEKAG
jgi:diadenylate cyclase